MMRQCDLCHSYIIGVPGEFPWYYPAYLQTLDPVETGKNRKNRLFLDTGELQFPKLLDRQEPEMPALFTSACI